MEWNTQEHHQVWLATCSRFPEKLPGISQKVAQKFFFVTTVAQKVAKESKNFFVSLFFIWSDKKIINLYKSSIFVQFCVVRSIAK